MPKKSVTINRNDIHVVETYSINVTCPYCGNVDLVEEDYAEPEYHACYKCDKHFLIKYTDTKTDNSLKKKK